MRRSRLSKAELSLFAFPLCMALGAWWLGRPPAPRPRDTGLLKALVRDAGVRDLGTLAEDSLEDATPISSIVASRALSHWVQADKRATRFVLKWRYADPAPDWCQWTYTYDRAKGTLKVDQFLSKYGPGPHEEYSNVTDAMLSRVARRGAGSLLDMNLMSHLGCTYYYSDLKSGIIYTLPPDK